MEQIAARIFISRIIRMHYRFIASISYYFIVKTNEKRQHLLFSLNDFLFIEVWLLSIIYRSFVLFCSFEKKTNKQTNTIVHALSPVLKFLFPCSKPIHCSSVDFSCSIMIKNLTFDTRLLDRVKKAFCVHVIVLESLTSFMLRKEKEICIFYIL